MESRKNKKKKKKESSGRESEMSSAKSEGGDTGALGEGGSTVSSRVESAVGEGASEERVKVEEPREGSEVWRRAVENLLNQFQNWTHQFSVPCFVSSAAPTSEIDPVPYRSDHILRPRYPTFPFPYSQQSTVEPLSL